MIIVFQTQILYWCIMQQGCIRATLLMHYATRVYSGNTNVRRAIKSETINANVDKLNLRTTKIDTPMYIYGVIFQPDLQRYQWIPRHIQIVITKSITRNTIFTFSLLLIVIIYTLFNNIPLPKSDIDPIGELKNQVLQCYEEHWAHARVLPPTPVQGDRDEQQKWNKTGKQKKKANGKKLHGKKCCIKD